MRLVIIDASIALSWVLPDEDLSPSVTRLLLGFHAGGIELIAPSVWEYEVANALRVGVSRERISEEEGVEALRALLDLGISLRDFTPLAEAAWRLALARQLTVYDAAYLALAQQENCEFFTADKHLLKAAAETRLVRGVEEFE